MLRSLASVGGFTLLSRLTGFVRDVAMGATLGAGMLADAFTIAFRLPNHFRAIFGEGAFNAAYVPSYSRVLETEGAAQAKRFSAQMFTLLLGSQVVLLALALVYTRELLGVLAPGLELEPETLRHALVMTRITFPYLLCVTLVTLLSGTLNANGRFAAAAFAPVLLNASIVACLAALFAFPDAGVAASVGVALAGVLELALMIVAARRANLLGLFARPRWTADVKQFFKAFLPAVIGSAGVQIALFADTIIGSMLPTGGLASIYYADRLYQLPIGVIGIAAGTVLLPEMSRRFAAGDAAGALDAQNRTMALTLALSAPFFVAFVAMADLVMAGVFQRGAFTPEAALASARVLTAYGAGLFAVVLIRSAVASFQARGDTTTPMVIALAAVAVNVALKFLLFKPFGAAGLALATAVGAWINFLLLAAIAMSRGDMRPDATAWRVAASVAGACGLLALTAIYARAPVGELAARLAPHFVNEAHLALMGALGALVYFAALAGLLLAQGVRPGRLKPMRPAGKRP
ncbi:MAG: integral rane protein MviN [Hyphomicrobiales bacterium]|nr:integral rane protein MviN [Hyphomicrobiales bacterium]